MTISTAIKWIAMAIAIIVALLVLSALYFSGKFGRAPCTNEVLNIVKSPDGHYKAVVFTSDCGEGEDVSTQVSVLESPVEDLPMQPGNGLRFKGVNVPVTVSWVSNEQMTVAGPGSKATYTLKTIKNKVVLSLSP